jgi:hypothetical protein
MLKPAFSFVLGSSKSSTGTRPPHHSAARTDVVLLIRRTVRPRGYASGFDSPAALPAERRVLARWGWVGEMSELFEHPAGTIPGRATPSDRRGFGSTMIFQ